MQIHYKRQLIFKFTTKKIDSYVESVLERGFGTQASILDVKSRQKLLILHLNSLQKQLIIKFTTKAIDIQIQYEKQLIFKFPTKTTDIQIHNKNNT